MPIFLVALQNLQSLTTPLVGRFYMQIHKIFSAFFGLKFTVPIPK